MTGAADFGLAAVVLAGGRSSRLGQDKATLLLDGERLVDRTVTAARAGDASQIVVVGPPSVQVAGVRVLQESPPFGGPTAGLAAGLAALGEPEAVLVLACDLVDPGSAVEVLRAAWDGVADGFCLVDAEGRSQWLTAIYDGAALRRAVDALGDPNGQAMHRLVRTLAMRTVPGHGAGPLDIDTLDDLQRAKSGDNGPVNELPPIQAWVEHLCAELGVDPAAVDLRALLDMTREVAHNVDRPAAPVSAFIVGLAAAQRGGDAEAVAAATAQAADAARAWGTT